MKTTEEWIGDVPLVIAAINVITAMVYSWGIV